MGRIQFTEDAWDDYLYWIGCDKKTVKKINQLINDILRNGLHEGIGSTEPLKGNLYGQYSRRINGKGLAAEKTLSYPDAYGLLHCFAISTILCVIQYKNVILWDNNMPS